MESENVDLEETYENFNELIRNELTHLTKEELLKKLFLKKEKNLSDMQKKKLKYEEDFLKAHLSKCKTQESTIAKNILKLDQAVSNFNVNQLKAQTQRVLKCSKEESLVHKFLSQLGSSCLEHSFKMMNEEKLSRNYMDYVQLLDEEQKKKKKDEERYFASLRKVELQKIAARQRITREKTMRLERLNSIRQTEQEKKEEEEEDLNESFAQDTSAIEPVESADVLAAESKIIESLVLSCGSHFCSQCYRMLKRSSLFLKCDKCCPSTFKKQLPPPPPDCKRPRIPPGSICVGCETPIKRGEIVQCICCYIRQEFMKDFTPITCGGCTTSENVAWVDTYVGSKYEMINCGFCERLVNYLYVVEICTGCHDQVCLHCLRKNNFLAISVCNECHSRRQVNPYRKLQRKPTF